MAPTSRANPATLPLREPFPAIDQQVALVMEGWSADPDRVIRGLTTIVNALSVRAGWESAGLHSQDNGSTPWVVVARGAEELAYTGYQRREVACTLAPLLDERLTPDQRSAVLLGILLHEVGHVRGSEAYSWAIGNHVRTAIHRNRGQWLDRAAQFTNILEDDRTEADTAATFPVYRQVIRLARWWLVSRHEKITLHAPEYRDEVIRFAGNVIRYADWVDLETDPKTRREAKWWTQWASRWTFTSPEARLEGITEAIAKMMRTPERPQHEQPEPGDEPEDGDESLPGMDEDEQPGERPEDGDEDEASDEPGSGLEGDDTDTDDTDEDPEGDESEDEDGDDTSGPGAPTDEAGDGQPQDSLPDHVEDDLTDAEQAKAEALAVAQVTSAGTKRELVVRWQVPPEPTPPQYLVSDEAAEAVARVEAYRKARQAHYAATRIGRSSGMGRMNEQGDRVDIAVRVLDASRFNLPMYEPVAVAHSGVSAMNAAFRVARQRRDNPAVGTSGRKIDKRRVYRLGAEDPRVFIRAGNQSAENLDVHLLVDRSGSMGGSRLAACQTMLATIAQAMRTERHVRLTVWSESNHSPLGGLDSDHQSYLVRHWSTAEGYSIVERRIGGIDSGGGFHDASAIEAVAQMIEDQPGWRPVIAVLSDGEPIEPMGWVRTIVHRLRRKGVAVFGVGMAGGLTTDHIEMYGRDNLVQFDGDWNALGRGIMQMLARLLP